MQLKPVQDQVVAIVGASSGIGRVTALRFAARGARVVVAARGEPGLRSLVEEIRAAGGEAEYVVCDVSDRTQVEAVCARAVERFGRLDTWVNCAAVAVYARFEDTTPDEFRRVMDVNFHGQVHGLQAALPHLRRAGGGALIVIASVESIVSLPLHSAYAASKHALEGVVDAFRRELAQEGAPISLTSVKPASINTPFFNNARVKLDVKPQGAPPIYEPEVVADCVLYAAEHPVRDLWAGGAGKFFALSQSTAPSLVDAALARFGIPSQLTDDASGGHQPGNLDAPRREEQRVRGDFGAQARRTSVFTWLETHPRAATLAAVGALAGVALLRGRRDADRNGPRAVGTFADREVSRARALPADGRAPRRELAADPDTRSAHPVSPAWLSSARLAARR